MYFPDEMRPSVIVGWPVEVNCNLSFQIRKAPHISGAIIQCPKAKIYDIVGHKKGQKPHHVITPTITSSSRITSKRLSMKERTLLSPWNIKWVS